MEVYWLIQQLLNWSSIHFKKERFKLKHEMFRGLEGFWSANLHFIIVSLWMLLEEKFLKADKSSQVLVFFKESEKCSFVLKS